MPPSRDEVKLADVIRLGLPVETKLITGSTQLHRPVNWVMVLTDWDILPQQVQPQDLVLLPPSLQVSMTDLELRDSLQTLATLNVAAVVMFNPVSSELEAILGELDLAIAEVSAETTVRDTHKSLTSLLVDRQSQITAKGTQLYRTLAEMSRDDQGLQAMSAIIAKLTGNLVVIQDKRLEIMAYAAPPGSMQLDEKAFRHLITDKDMLPAVLRNRKAVAKATKSNWQQLLFPNHNIARLISPIVSGDRARGYVSIVGEAEALDLLDKVAVEQGAAAIALEMAKAKAVSEAKKQLRGDFLEGVLVGTLPPREIERLSSRLDHDTEQPHAVVTFRWAPGSYTKLRHIESALNWLVSSDSNSALIHTYGEDHVCVFQMLRSPEDLGPAKRLAQRVREHLEAEHPGVELSSGLSGPAESLAQWPTVHAQSVQAMDVGQRLHLHEIVEFNSLGVYRLLGQLDNVSAVNEFCDSVIGPLVTYDEQHRSNLVETIAAYFEHHGNISQTAESLFIHRNTLLYRLDRIQDLTGQAMNQADMRLALHLALKLWLLRPETRLKAE